MRNIMILSIVLVLLATAVSGSYYEYNETGDTYAFNANWDGVDCPADLHDEDENTYCTMAVGTVAKMYVNYTQTNDILGAKLTFKRNVVGWSNYTISAGCRDKPNDKIELRYQVSDSASTIRGDCYTGSGWAFVFDSSYAGDNYLYEEGIFWEKQGGLKECGGAATTVALNLSLYEDNSTLVNGSIDGYFNLQDENKSNISLSDQTSYELCIYPPTLNTTYSAQIEYTAPGYNTETYYITDANIDNVVDYIQLFLTSNYTQVAFTVTDQDDNTLEDVYIYVMEYDLPTNSSHTTEILKTDYTGEAMGNIQLATTKYKFLLIYNEDIVLETSPVILLLTSYTFRVNLQTDYFSDYGIINKVVCNLNYANATKNFTFSYTDPSEEIVKSCLKITQKSSLGEVVVSNTCKTEYSSTIIKHITPLDGDFTYIGQGYIYLGNSSFICDEDYFSYDTVHRTYGDTGLFGSFMLIVTLAMVGIWSPVAAIILTLVALITGSLLKIFYLSWPALVSLIIIGGIALFKASRK